MHIHVHVHRVSDGNVQCTCTSIIEKVLIGRAILAQPAKLVTPSGLTLSLVNIIIDINTNVTKATLPRLQSAYNILDVFPYLICMDYRVTYNVWLVSEHIAISWSIHTCGFQSEEVIVTEQIIM